MGGGGAVELLPKAIGFSVSYSYPTEQEPETDGNISIVSKRPIPRPLVSVSVSIRDIFESRYQYQSRLRPLDHILFDMKGFLIK